MATMKAKNSSGEWVDIGLAEMVSDMKIAFIKPFNNTTATTNKNAYDLSPYVKGTDNFILFFCTSQGSTMSGSSLVHVWIRSDGQLRKEHTKTSNQLLTLDDVFQKSSQFDYTFDEETHIFSITITEPSSECFPAVLFYIGTKEA